MTGLILLPLFRLDPKAFKVLVVFVSAFGAFGLFALLQGIRQLHFALNPKASQPATTPTARSVSAPRTTALPVSALRASVTEGTTELLVSNLSNDERRTPEPVSRVQDTGEVDDERLM